MQTWRRCCPNVSYLVALAPEAAAAKFDLMILDPALGDLLVPAGPLVKANPDRYDALRRLPARLLLAGGRRERAVAVELELLPWSTARCDLAITCIDTRRMPLGIGVTRYRETADAALEVLGRLMESGSVRPNRRVTSRRPAAPAATGASAPGPRRSMRRADR